MRPELFNIIVSETPVHQQYFVFRQPLGRYGPTHIEVMDAIDRDDFASLDHWSCTKNYVYIECFIAVTQNAVKHFKLYWQFCNPLMTGRGSLYPISKYKNYATRMSKIFNKIRQHELERGDSLPTTEDISMCLHTIEALSSSYYMIHCMEEEYYHRLMKFAREYYPESNHECIWRLRLASWLDGENIRHCSLRDFLRANPCKQKCQLCIIIQSQMWISCIGG